MDVEGEKYLLSFIQVEETNDSQIENELNAYLNEKMGNIISNQYAVKFERF